MTPNVSVVVFSAVDGILRDRASLFDAAAGALDLLAHERIPLVFCSSRTRAELELLHQELGLRHPFLCENAGAVFWPRAYFGFDVPTARDVAGYQAIECGRPYAEVVDALHRTAERLRLDIVGFSDMSVEEVAIDCDLPLMQARLAKLREYEEPFRILDRDAGARSRLFKALHAARLGCTTGGRYDYVGAAVDRAVGVNVLFTLFRRALGRVFTIGVGESLNAVPLLRRVDLALIVENDNTDVIARLLTQVPTARLTPAGGVAGWASAILATVETIRERGRPDLPVQSGGSRSRHQHLG